MYYLKSLCIPALQDTVLWSMRTFTIWGSHISAKTPIRQTRYSPSSALHCTTSLGCIQQSQDEATALANSQSPAQNFDSNSEGFSTLMFSIQKASFILFSPTNTFSMKDQQVQG